ncbi:MAG: hypothetical protein ABSB74_11260 [Tepidisphaeraceae bacterium]
MQPPGVNQPADYVFEFGGEPGFDVEMIELERSAAAAERFPGVEYQLAASPDRKRAAKGVLEELVAKAAITTNKYLYWHVPLTALGASRWPRDRNIWRDSAIARGRLAKFVGIKGEN